MGARVVLVHDLESRRGAPRGLHQARPEALAVRLQRAIEDAVVCCAREVRDKNLRRVLLHRPGRGRDADGHRRDQGEGENCLPAHSAPSVVAAVLAAPQLIAQPRRSLAYASGMTQLTPLRDYQRARQDSNLRLLPPEGSALSTELRARTRSLVVANRVETTNICSIRPKAYCNAMHPAIKGNGAEAAVLEGFVRRGFGVLLPFGGGHPYDLVVELPSGEFLRVQCKTAWRRKGCLLFNARTTDHGRGRLLYLGLAD